MLCITIADEDKHINIINGKAIGASKHIDYALFHWKAADVKALKQPITKFIFINAEGKVSEVIPAAQLKDRGTNYKTAKRDPIELAEVEQEEVDTAVELAAEFIRAAAAPKVKPADTKPAAEVPKIFLTPEAVSVGLKEFRENQKNEQQDNSETSDTATTVSSYQPADQSGDDGSEQDPDATVPDDPVSTMKPSRAKKRR